MLGSLLALGPSALLTAWIASRRAGDGLRLLMALIAGLAAGVIVLELLPELLPRASVPTKPGWYSAVIGAWAIAALPEESAKLLAIMAVGLSRHARPGTWLRVGAVVGLGYAAFENLLHLVVRPDETPALVLRAVTSLPAHALFGLYAGALLGFGQNRRVRAACAAWIASMALHVGYDAPLFFLARESTHDQGHWVAVGVFSVVLGGGWLGAWRLRSSIDQRENRAAPSA